MIDGLARAGLLDDAVSEVRAHVNDSVIGWMSVMGGARIHDRVDIAEMALNHIRRLDPMNEDGLAAACVLMAHVYTKHGDHDKAASVRGGMRDNGIHKIPGESSIEVNGVMHTFRVGDTSHPEMDQIIALNDELHEQMRGRGYEPDITWSTHGGETTSDVSKAQLLCEHSERLALVYGLLHSRGKGEKGGEDIRLFKNLRVCGDCHEATKYASGVIGRRIVVKDANRWHTFENGVCSCGDFW